jgi:hypothetical protein
LAFNSSYYSPSREFNKRICFVLVANEQIVKVCTDRNYAMEQYKVLVQMYGRDRVAVPMVTDLIDNQTIDSRGWNKVRLPES